MNRTLTALALAAGLGALPARAAEPPVRFTEDRAPLSGLRLTPEVHLNVNGPATVLLEYGAQIQGKVSVSLTPTVDGAAQPAANYTPASPPPNDSLFEAPVTGALELTVGPGAHTVGLVAESQHSMLLRHAWLKITAL